MTKIPVKHVLGIVGSPRRGGNTEVLVDEILLGAQSVELQTEKILLVDYKIAPCNACDGCLKTRKCVIKDDMSKILEKLRTSDIWVLGTPVYWWGPTAQFKTFVDRWYGQAKDIFANKSAVLVIPLGDTEEVTANHTVGMLNDALSYLKIPILQTLIATGMDTPGQVRQNTAIMSTARLIGQKMK